MVQKNRIEKDVLPRRAKIFTHAAIIVVAMGLSGLGVVGCGTHHDGISAEDLQKHLDEHDAKFVELKKQIALVQQAEDVGDDEIVIDGDPTSELNKLSRAIVRIRADIAKINGDLAAARAQGAAGAPAASAAEDQLMVLIARLTDVESKVVGILGALTAGGGGGLARPRAASDGGTVDGFDAVDEAIAQLHATLNAEKVRKMEEAAHLRAIAERAAAGRAQLLKGGPGVAGGLTGDARAIGANAAQLARDKVAAAKERKLSAYLAANPAATRADAFFELFGERPDDYTVPGTAARAPASPVPGRRPASPPPAAAIAGDDMTKPVSVPVPEFVQMDASGRFPANAAGEIIPVPLFAKNRAGEKLPGFKPVFNVLNKQWDFVKAGL